MYSAALFPPDAGTMTGAIVDLGLRGEGGREGRGEGGKEGRGDRKRMSFRFDLCSVFFPSLFFFVKNEIPLLLRGFPLVPPPPSVISTSVFFLTRSRKRTTPTKEVSARSSLLWLAAETEG